MKIGFYLQLYKNSFDIKKKGLVLGDELIAVSLAKYMSMDKDVTSVEIFAPNHLPTDKVDIMIYMNDVKPNPAWADKHVVYLQNGFIEGGDTALNRFYSYGYDGYIIYSHKLYDMHIANGHSGAFIPFGVDLDIFKPLPKDPDYNFDCVYVGNDIKGEERSLKYIYPGIHFNFGLYGGWKNPRLPLRRRIKELLRISKYPPEKHYQKVFRKISQGKINPYDQPKLYSGAKIILNCTLQDSVDWDVMTLRTLEVLACKGFLISDRVPIAEKLLEDCLVFTDGGKDLEDKIHYYLAHPEERARIAQKGYDYVTTHCSYQSRAAEMLAYLKTI